MSKNLGSLVRDVIDGTSSFVTGEDLNGERYGPGILPDEKKWRSLQKTEDSGHMDDGSFIMNMCTLNVFHR